MIEDPDRCYAALQARDARFDGWFFVGVTSTGIYCRPSCPALTPQRANVRFHASAAAAQAAGFRACRRCRPDAVPGSPEWDGRGDLVARAMRAIADGVVDRDGVAGLARRLGYSPRHLHRELTATLGAGPRALARAQRAQTARVLIEATELPFTEVAFAAGFGSVRQFNDTVRAVFGVAPSTLRRQRRTTGSQQEGEVALRLAFRQPASLDQVLAHLRARAVPGLEAVTGECYHRALTLPRGGGSVGLHPTRTHVHVRLRLADLRDIGPAVTRCRQLWDLDADPVAVDAHLARDRYLRPLVLRRPGLRIPRTVDPFEAAVRAVVGQQVSVAAARTLTGRLVAAIGETLSAAHGGVTHRFPTPEALASADPIGAGLTGRRAETVRRLAAAVASGNLDLDAGADREAVRASLLAIDGIGPWTAEIVAMRGIGDPDAWPATDLALVRAAGRQGLPGHPGELTRRAAAWRPWRTYAVHHLWSADTEVRSLAA